MAKSVIKSYEDWTPPKFLQGEDEDIDLERVKLEFYTRESENAQYRRQNRSLKEQVADLRSQVDDNDDDDSDDTDEAPKPKSKSKSEGEGQGPSLNEIRLELALEKGLTKNQVMRLRGTNREELEADAEAYMEEHGLAGNSDDDNGDGDDNGNEGGGETSGPPSRQPRRGDGKSGLERGDGEPTHYDPSKLMDLV